MKAQPLSNSAEFVLASLYLEKNDEETVRICIHNYSTPHTFCQTLHWLVFRITNGIKHIFGKSDWQKAENIVRQHTNITVDLMFMDTKKNPSPPLFKRIEETCRKVAEHAALNLLANCLLANKENFDLSPEFKKFVAEAHFSNHIKNLVQAVKEEFSRGNNLNISH
jgi:hypothetical protein